MEALTKELIESNLKTDDEWLTRAIVVLDEQTDPALSYKTYDKTFFSSLASRLKSGKPLTDKQKECAKKSICKYSKVLLILALAKQQEETLKHQEEALKEQS